MTIKIYKFINAESGNDDKRLKVSADDTAAGFLEEKLVVAETTNATEILALTTLNGGSNEQRQIGIDETKIDHDVLTNFVDNEHINHATVDIATGADSGLAGGGDITTTRNIEVDIAGTTQETSIEDIDELLIEDVSATAKRKVTREDFLDGYVRSTTRPVTTRSVPVYDGTTGDFIDETGVTIDASDNVVIPGNLQVDGTQTIFNTEIVDIEDANITVNKNGNQSVANSNTAGLTIEMSDASDVVFGYDSSTTSRMKVGDDGDEREIATISHTQTLTNKTIDGTSATGTNTVTTDANDVTYNNSTSGLTATDSQAAIDEVEDRLDTAEATLSDHLDGGTSKHDATEIDYERIDGSKKNIQATSDEVESALTDLDDAIGALEATPTNYLPTDATIVSDHLSGIDTELGNLQDAIDLKQDDVITTEGDLVLGDDTGEEARLAIGASGTVLSSDGTTASWAVNPDERIKVSANDTTEKYLEEAIVVSSGSNSTEILELSTLNDAGDEDLQIQIDETKIDHDALTNFVSDEHIDHSAVEITTIADSGLTGGGDITTTRNLSVDITNTTEETSVETNDEILIYDTSASVLKKASVANILDAGRSEGDIIETSFSLANDTSVSADITGLAFANATVRSFKALLSVEIDATADLFEVFEITGIQRGSDWSISTSSNGDSSNVGFTITSAGQVQYTSADNPGFVSGLIKFRAITTSV